MKEVDKYGQIRDENSTATNRWIRTTETSVNSAEGSWDITKLSAYL